MSKALTGKESELSRREFLTAAGGVAAGITATGLAGKAQAGEPKPGRGGTVVELMANSNYPYMQQTGELLQAMWSEVGFKVKFNIVDSAVRRAKRRSGDFHADSAAGSYRFDPDGYYGRQVLSTASYTKQMSRFRNERADKLVLEARKTADRKKRLEMYYEVDSIVNDELPYLYTHHLTLMEAGAMNVKGYQPAISGAPSTRGAGIRTAWMA